MKKLLFVLFIVFITACQRESALQKLCRKIRNTPQTTVYPPREDKKWLLIKELEEIKDKDLPDSVKAIFRHIDTSIQGYDNYRYKLLTLLVKPDSRNSLKAMAEIFQEHYISDPSCSQVLTHFFTDESLYGDMLLSYITKKNSVDYSKVLKNIDVMFPGLTQVLGKQPFSDGPILDLMTWGVKSGVLNKNNLASSRDQLVRYYDYLKYVRDTLLPRQSTGYRYNSYYETHLPRLLAVLKVFNRDSEIGRILAETANTKETP